MSGFCGRPDCEICAPRMPTLGEIFKGVMAGNYSTHTTKAKRRKARRGRRSRVIQRKAKRRRK